MLVAVTFVPVIIPAITVSFPITRNILVFIPVIAYKQDPLAAGVIFVTVLVPMFGVARRDTHIDRRAIDQYPPFNNYRLNIQYPWTWEVADINPAIKTGLADTNRKTNIGSGCREIERGSGHYR